MILQHFFNYPIMLCYSLVYSVSESVILYLGVGIAGLFLIWLIGRLIGG